jgi:hypothetical protein
MLVESPLTRPNYNSAALYWQLLIETKKFNSDLLNIIKKKQKN